MTTPHIIRKRLLEIFSQKAIPSLFAREMPQLIVAEPPFHFPTGIRTTVLPQRLLRDKPSHANELVRRWKRACVNSTQWPYLMYLCGGEADIRIGITQRMAKIMKEAGQNADSGCLVVTLRSPALLLLPPGIPYSDGSGAHWERAEPFKKHPTIVWIHLSPTGILCHYCSEERGVHRSEHPLLLQDPLLMSIYHILYDELRTRAPDFEKAALAQLQTLMLRLQRRVTLDRPVVGNTAWPESQRPSSNRQGDSGRSTQSAALLAKLHSYIQIHLREPLSLSQLAAEAGLSPAHLNRLCHNTFGTTAMRYVTRLRMEAAQEIMEVSSAIPIKEVMQLTGYTQLPHFSRVFSQTFGMSPREFRNQQRKEKSG